MKILFSKTSEYAIQAMACLGGMNSPNPVMIGEIAETCAIPRQFLSKITQVLVKHRLVTTRRGRYGGVMLARPAQEIFLSEIVRAVEGPAPETEQCLFGFDVCSEDRSCPLHPRWKAIRLETREMLENENLDHFARELLTSGKKKTGTLLSFS